MPEYSFVGRGTTGNKLTGKRNAATALDLSNRLQQEGITPVSIEEITQQASLRERIDAMLPGKKVVLSELLMFCRQMHTLNKAGIPIISAVTRLADTTRNKVFAKVLRDIIDRLSAGQTLGSALALHPNIFSPLFINIVSVGESTGKLEEVFLELSRYLDLDQQTQKRVKTALRYPAIVITAGLTAVVVINAFVVPAFAKMFASFKRALPLPTRILISTSYYMTHYWHIIVAAVLITIVVGTWYFRTPAGRLLWHRTQLHLPLMGWIIIRIYLARFCRLFALVMGAGIPAIEGMGMVISSIGNDYMAQKLKVMREAVSRGSSIAMAAKQVDLFSPLVVQMLALGEETGRMEAMLDDVAEFYEREVEYDLAKLSDAIEPILLLIMAAMVLVLALGVFLPMWDMVDMAKT